MRNSAPVGMPTVLSGPCNVIPASNGAFGSITNRKRADVAFTRTLTAGDGVDPLPAALDAGATTVTFSATNAVTLAFAGTVTPLGSAQQVKGWMARVAETPLTVLEGWST